MPLLEKPVKFSKDTKLLIFERCQGVCEMCGMPAMDPQFHHRRPRGMGGTSRKETGSPANALYVHPSCHASIESNRSSSLENGYLVSQSADPASVRVLRWGVWVMLNEDGSVTDAGNQPIIN